MHPRRFLYLVSFALVAASTSACADDSATPATVVPLQPSIVRPPLATPLPATQAPLPTSIPPVASPSPSPPPAGRTFTVRDGDSLSTIAGVVYADASQWRVIFEANRDQLSSEDALQVGQVLRVPPLPPATPTAAPTRTS